MLPTLLLTIAWQVGQMQQEPLSLTNITSALRSKKTNDLAYKNEILIAAVNKRGISFTLTPEIERQLRGAGANPALIEAIRQKSPKLPSPTPVTNPTVVSTPPPPPAPAADLYLRRGDEYVAKGEYDRAVLFYDEAILLNPSDAESYYKRGFAYHYKNNHDRAFEDYKTAIRLKTDLALQPLLRCVLYNSKENNNPEKAIEDCGKTIDSTSNFALAYYIRANAYRDKKDADRAIGDYNKFIEFNPKNVLAYINRGDAFFDKKDYERAAADYNKAIELDKGNELAKKNLQRLQAEQASITINIPKTTPMPAAPAAPSEKLNPQEIIDVGVINNRAVKLKKPSYPEGARNIGIQDKVTVRVTLDENGNVISAKAISGHGLLRSSCEIAARNTKFNPTLINGQPVKVTGIIVYDFSFSRR
jgi:TonB family protein